MLYLSIRVHGHYKYFILSVRDRLKTSESDVYGRQILAYEDGPRAERIKMLDQHLQRCSHNGPVLDRHLSFSYSLALGRKDATYL